jgi:hypothetical protein
MSSLKKIKASASIFSDGPQSNIYGIYGKMFRTGMFLDFLNVEQENAKTQTEKEVIQSLHDQASKEFWTLRKKLKQFLLATAKGTIPEMHACSSCL